jgi:hypothetical protein
MRKLHLSLANLVNIDKSKKAGDASDKSYLATTTDTPAYLHANRICYEEYQE